MKTTRNTSSSVFWKGRLPKDKRQTFSSSGIALFIMILAWTLGGQSSFSQGVGISEVSIVPDPSAILELRYTGPITGPFKGFLTPRLTSAQRIAILTPAQGLLVYDTTTESFWYFEGTWKTIASGTLGSGDQLLGMNAGGTANEYKTLFGTTNRVSVAHALGSITLSTPQDIHTLAIPEFAGMKVSGLTGERGVYTDINNFLTTTPPTTGVLGYWNRFGGVLSPTTISDAVTTNGNIYTGGSGTITSAGLLTGSLGLTVTGGEVNLNNGSAFATNINTGGSTGSVTIGGTGVQNINVGSSLTGGSTIALGSTSSTTNINSGSGAINLNLSNNQPTNINTGGSTGTVTIGGTGTQTISVGAGASGVKTISIGNTVGATSITQRVGSGNFSLDGSAGSTYSIGSSATTGTITLGGSLMTTGSTTIYGGTGTGALTLTPGTAGTIVIGAPAGTGAITVGSSTGSQTVNIGTGTGDNDVNIATGVGASGGIVLGNTTGLINVPKLNPLAGVYTDGTRNLTSTPPISGTIGYWKRDDALSLLSPSNGSDNVTTSGYISTTGGGITSAGLLTGQSGATITGATTISGGVVSINNNSTNATNINTGSSGGAVNIASGGTGVNAISIGNKNVGTSLVQRVGTGNYSLDGAATSTYSIGASTVAGTISLGGTAQTGTITVGSSSGANTLNIANGTGATTLNLANTQTGGSVNIGSGMTTGSISIGGTGLQTGTIGIGTGMGAQTLNFGSGGTGTKTINIGTGSAVNAITIGNTDIGTTIKLPGLDVLAGVYTDGFRNLTSTPPISGTIGYWKRDDALSLLSPSNGSDNVTTSGYISTTGGGITSAGLLTGQNGATVTGLLQANDDVTLGSSNTDALIVNATADFNDILNVDGVTTLNDALTVADGATATNINNNTINLGNDLTDNITATGNVTIADGASTTSINANTINIGNGATDAVDITGETNLNGGGVTIASDLTISTGATVDNILTAVRADGTAEDTKLVTEKAVRDALINSVNADNGLTENPEGTIILGGDLDAATTINTFAAGNTLTIQTDGGDDFIVDGTNGDLIVDQTGNTSITGTATLTTGTGQVTLGGNVDANAGVEITGGSGLDVGAGSFTVDNTGNVDAAGTLNADGAVNLSTAGSATVVEGTLNVVQAADLDNTLNVDGSTTLNGAVTLGDAAGDAVTIPGTVQGLTTNNDIVFDEATNNLTFAVSDQGTGAATLTVPDLLGVNQTIATLSDVQGSDALIELTDVSITDYTAGSILVADGINSYDQKALSGDATIASDGTLTISSDAIGSAEITDGSILAGDIGTLTTIDINGGTIDGVTLGTNSVVTQANVDNLKLDGNTLSSTNTDGNIVLDPNGTGVVNVNTSLISNVTNPVGAQDAATKNYADGKVADAINDGTTTIAPSQNAVFDALALKAPTGNYLTALTGDATASGPGSATLTLAIVNSNTGPIGSSTAIPTITTNDKGLVTAVTTNAVVAPAGTLTGTTLAANVVSSSLESVGTLTSGAVPTTLLTGTLAATQFPALTGAVTTTAGSLATTITDKAVTLAKMDDLSQNTIIGRITGSTGVPEALTAANVRTIINVADGATANAKATGAELDAGTDDVKYATASALKASHNVPSVIPGTAGYVLTSDGTDWISAANYTHPTGDGNLHVPATSTTNNGKVLTAGATAGSLTWETPTTGTVTTVGLSLPPFITVSNSPVTSSGTLTGTLASQIANNVFAAPNGSDGAPSFRSLVASDIPNLDWGKITSGIPTTLAGYGITDAASSSHNHALDGLSDVTVTSNSAGEVLKWNGSDWVNNTLAEAGIQPAGSYLTSYTETDPVVKAINGIVMSNGTVISSATAGTDYLAPAGDGSALTGLTGGQIAGNILGNAANVTGIVDIANGGTGQSTQQAAINALTGTQTAGTYLRSNGTNATLSTIPASEVVNTPAGTIDATNVQTALNELDVEKAPLASPTFTGSITTPTINLSATSNQIVMQSAGVTGTLSWSPTTSNNIITFPDASGEVALVSSTSWNIGGNAPGSTSVLGTTDNSGINIQSGTGTINLGADAFAKTINIGNTTDATAVNVNTGTGNFALNTNQLFINKTTGDIGMGTNAPLSPLHLVFNNITNQNLTMDEYGGGNSTIIGRKARGTAATPSAVQANDVLMTFGASGHDGTLFSTETKAAVKFYASEDWTPSAQGTYFTFITTPNGKTARAEVLRIDNIGNVGIGITAPTAKLHLKGSLGTANTAPLKFTAGTNLGAAEDGAVEYDGTNYYGTITTGPTRKTFAFLESPVFTTPNIGAASGTSLVLSGDVTAKHLVGAAGTPSVTLGPGASGTPTGKSIAGTDLGGSISYTTGGANPTANSLLATITFNSSYASAPSAIIITAGENYSGLEYDRVYVSNITSTYFEIRTTSTAMGAGSGRAHKFYFMVVQ